MERFRFKLLFHRLFLYFNSMNHAREIFARTRYKATDSDIKDLACNMGLLASRSLEGLNDRLRQARSKTFDTIAEHNVAAMLLRHFGDRAIISYEPVGYGPRPVDFKIVLCGQVYWLQMKRFGDLERENRRQDVIRKIEEEAEKISVPKFFTLELHESFSANHVLQLLQHLAGTAPASIDGNKYDLIHGGMNLATAEYWSQRTLTLSGLTLGAVSDLGAVEITGLAAGQIRESIRKAGSAFLHPADTNNVNVILAEADNCDDIDIGDACFGTEYEVDHIGGGGWSRMDDGMFLERPIADLVVGLMVLRRPKPRVPISGYAMLLYANERHLGLAELVGKTFPVAQIIRKNMRPDESGSY